MLLRVPPWISDYRVNRLTDLIGDRLRNFEAASVLDVGCGRGRITARLKSAFPSFTFGGVDVIVQPDADIAVERYDGTVLPFVDKSMDVVMLIDVLHHADDPLGVLLECRRVARRMVLVKDHLCETIYDWARLASLDWLGNRPFGIPMRYTYFSRQKWERLFLAAKLRCGEFKTEFQTCPPPFDRLLDTGVQLLAALFPESS